MTTKTLKMDRDDTETTRNNFYDAQDDSESKEKGFPKSVDGGDEAEHIAETIAKIAKGAGDITIRPGPGGDKMANAVDKTRGVNEGVAQMFREIEKKIS